MGALKNNLLVSVLRGDIERFLNTNTELMFNERDLQVRVATTTRWTWSMPCQRRNWKHVGWS